MGYIGFSLSELGMGLRFAFVINRPLTALRNTCRVFLSKYMAYLKSQLRTARSSVVLSLYLTCRIPFTFIETLKSGIGADLVLFSVWLVVPVSGCTNFLGFCPVSHAVSLTITQRHGRGGEEMAHSSCKAL